MSSPLRRRRLGQYFTPEGVARFAWDALFALGMALPEGARVADPALGQGVFLRAGMEAKAAPKEVEWVGVDRDPQVASAWHPSWRTAVGNGLLDHPTIGLLSGSCDVVVGNPPFGGEGLGILGSLLLPHPPQEALDLMRILLGPQYLAWKAETRAKKSPPLPSWQAPVLDPSSLRPALTRLVRHPVELVFTERFLRLLKPGGYLACVVPEGVLANTESAPLRRILEAEMDVLAVVGLPPQAFLSAGASARTALLMGRKRTSGDPPSPDVWITQPAPHPGLRTQEEESYLERVLSSFRGERPS